MGKLKLDLLKGIEEEEKVIDTSKTNNKAINIKPDPPEEVTEEQVQMKSLQIDETEKMQTTKGNAKTDKITDNKKNEQKISKVTNKNSEIIKNIDAEVKTAEKSLNKTTTEVLPEKNSKKKCINFDISDIDRYLTAAAGVHGKSKTKYLHDLVIADMEVHPEIKALINITNV